MTRPFYEWQGGTDQDHEALTWFSTATPEQMGPRLARFRPGVTTSVLAKVTVLWAIVGAGLIAMLALLAPGGLTPTRATVTILVVSGVFALVMGAMVLAARWYYQDVHRHGLVSHAPGSSGTVVIPWATIDPGKIFIGMSVRSGTRMPVPLHRQRAVFPPAVMVNGWTNRPRGGAEAVEAVSSGYRYQPMPTDSPFGWWQFGAKDPGAFLTAIEKAMRADGYPAVGLTRDALSRKVFTREMRRDPSLQQERQLVDPVVGLPEQRQEGAGSARSDQQGGPDPGAPTAGDQR